MKSQNEFFILSQGNVATHEPQNTKLNTESSTDTLITTTIQSDRCVTGRVSVYNEA